MKWEERKREKERKRKKNGRTLQAKMVRRDISRFANDEGDKSVIHDRYQFRFGGGYRP